MGKEEFKNPHPELPVREPILKLGKMITDRVPIKLGFEKLTADSPEYWGLAPICTDEQANIALKMGVRKPKTLKQMVQITGMDEKELEKQLEQMSFNGLLEYNWENPQHEKQYVLPMFVPGSAEFTNMNSTVLEEHPEMGRFFERMSRLPLEKITPMVPPGGAGIGMHVIPVEKAIDMNNEAISLEKISYWLDKYDGKYAASPCSCRKSRKTYDEGCADDPEDWCIAVGDMADYVVETGKGGHYITKEEALEIFKKAEDNGFVHQITNIDGQDKIFAICNCNVNVCYALRTSQLFNTPNMSRSAYVAKVTKENCVACGKCVEYCPAGAVKLGQKLCTKDGSEIKYPKMPLPSEQKWGPHMWTEDYRDKNRINCYDTGTAPCKTACPAHIAVQGYLKMAAQGRYKDALALIKKDNPFPAVCGHVCNRRCEDACTRGTIDEAIAIDEVKGSSAVLKAEQFTAVNKGIVFCKLCISFVINRCFVIDFIIDFFPEGIIYALYAALTSKGISGCYHIDVLIRHIKRKLSRHTIEGISAVACDPYLITITLHFLQGTALSIRIALLHSCGFDVICWNKLLVVVYTIFRYKIDYFKHINRSCTYSRTAHRNSTRVRKNKCIFRKSQFIKELFFKIVNKSHSR